MKCLITAVLILFAIGCSSLRPEEDKILVRVSNEAETAFTKVVLDLGVSDDSEAVFQSVAPGTLTEYEEVRTAFSQPFTVRAQTEGEEKIFNVEAVIAIPLEPGRYTYVVTVDEQDRLYVERNEAAGL